MRTKSTLSKPTTRRAFLGGSATVAGWAMLSPRLTCAAAPTDGAPGKPNSVFNGVRIGCITYSYRGALNTADEISRPLSKTASARWN